MINLWYAEAGANDAFPLDDRSPLEIILTPRPVLTPPRDRYLYYPGVADVPESQTANIRNRSYAIGALVDIPEHGSKGATGASGVLFAHGARFGGHALSREPKQGQRSSVEPAHNPKAKATVAVDEYEQGRHATRGETPAAPMMSGRLTGLGVRSRSGR